MIGERRVEGACHLGTGAGRSDSEVIRRHVGDVESLTAQPTRGGRHLGGRRRVASLPLRSRQVVPVLSSAGGGDRRGQRRGTGQVSRGKCQFEVDRCGCGHGAHNRSVRSRRSGASRQDLGPGGVAVPVTPRRPARRPGRMPVPSTALMKRRLLTWISLVTWVIATWSRSGPTRYADHWLVPVDRKRPP